jgi:DNA-directed RNA polymerase sigma subunit (sigma70/sigma32)
MMLSEPEQSVLMLELLKKFHSVIKLNNERKLKHGKRCVINPHRDVDIVVGHAVHNMTFAELGHEHNISAGWARQIYCKNLRAFSFAMKKEGLLKMKDCL